MQHLHIYLSSCLFVFLYSITYKARLTLRQQTTKSGSKGTSDFTCSFKCHSSSFCWHWGFLSAGRLLPAGTLPALSESGHPTEESGPQQSGQHPLKGTQTNAYTVTYICSSICLQSLISHPAGTCWGVHVRSERQRDVHCARRRPALPAALCLRWRRGGSDVCSCPCS